MQKDPNIKRTIILKPNRNHFAVSVACGLSMSVDNRILALFLCRRLTLPSRPLLHHTFGQQISFQWGTLTPPWETFFIWNHSCCQPLRLTGKLRIKLLMQVLALSCLSFAHHQFSLCLPLQGTSWAGMGAGPAFWGLESFVPAFLSSSWRLLEGTLWQF